MTIKQNIPVFTETGKGLTADLINIKKAEIIAWGWWKNQLFKHMDNNCSVHTDVETGIEYWNDEASISPSASCDKSSSQYKFLEILGFSKENLIELCSASGDVDSIDIGFNPKVEFTSSYFSGAVAELESKFPSVTGLTISYTSVAYDEASYPLEEDRIKYLLTPFGSYLGLYEAGDLHGLDTSYFVESKGSELISQGIATTSLNLLSLMEYVDLSFEGSAGDLDNAFYKDTFKSLLLMAQDLGYSNRTVVSYTERIAGGIVYHDVVETYSRDMITSYVEDYFETHWHESDEEHYDKTIYGLEDDGFMTRSYFHFYQNVTWHLFEGFGMLGIHSDAFKYFFIEEIEVPYSGTENNIVKKLRLRRDTLKGADDGEFMFYYVRFLDIDIVPEGGGLLGIIKMVLIMYIVSLAASYVSSALSAYSSVPALTAAVQTVSSTSLGIGGATVGSVSAVATTTASSLYGGGFSYLTGMYSGAIAVTPFNMFQGALQAYNLTQKVDSFVQSTKETDKNRGIEKEEQTIRAKDHNNQEDSVEDMYNGSYDLFAQYNLPKPFDANGEFDKAISLENLKEKGA